MRTHITPLSIMPLPTRSTVAGESRSKMDDSKRAYLLNSTSTVPLFFGLVATCELRGTKLEQTLLERTVGMERSRRSIGGLLGNTCVRLPLCFSSLQ